MELVHEYDILCFEEMFQMGSFRSERIIDYAIDHSMLNISRVLVLEDELTTTIYSRSRC